MNPGSAAQDISARQQQPATVELTAVVVAVTTEQPRTLVVRLPRGASASAPAARDALPSGPLQLHHRTLDAGLRAWVEEQTGARLGYVEQLYTFGDRNRTDPQSGRRVLSIGYLALARETGAEEQGDARWRNWYDYFPWEDWRRGKPAILTPLRAALRRWSLAASDQAARRGRKQRIELAFGVDDGEWNDERALERYELLYEVGLVIEAHRDGATSWARPEEVPAGGEQMLADHRRILATAIARLRGKIKYRPVVFELMPPTFTLLQLQRAVEALAGVRLHKQNFRRLVAQQGLVEETGQIVTATGGRPAREVRFRREVMLEHPAPGLRLPIARDQD